jgi:hypothetical protein
VIPNPFAALKSGCQGECQWGAPTNRRWTNWHWRAWLIFRCCGLLIRRSPASARSKEQSSSSINKCGGGAQKFILPEHLLTGDSAQFGKDAFHRVPFIPGEVRDAVERVLTSFMGRDRTPRQFDAPCAPEPGSGRLVPSSCKPAVAAGSDFFILHSAFPKKTSLAPPGAYARLTRCAVGEPK